MKEEIRDLGLYSQESEHHMEDDRKDLIGQRARKAFQTSGDILRTTADAYKWGGGRKHWGPASKSRVGTLSLVRSALEN